MAQAKFLRPQDPTNITYPAINPQLDNRWYRILELLDVPTRANMQVENSLLSKYPWLFPQALQRTQGRLNLNGIRYGENVFAMLDDPYQFLNPLNNSYNSNTGSYLDYFENGRDWWQQFVQARDKQDITTSLYLPGSPRSRPFRPLSHYDNNPNNYAANPVNSLDDTLLRTLPLDSGIAGLDKRGLFEARAQLDLVSMNAGGGNTIDYYARQRLLSKIAGNTTPRSNTFLVWISVGFFEVYQPGLDPTVIQIGAQMQDQTPRRGFFVIDRSLLEEAWVPDPNTPNNGYFDYSKFILYRKTLQ